MAAQKPAAKEPSIEEMMAATKEPSIEEMMAASKGPDVAPSIEFNRPAAADPTAMDLSERLIRGGRQVAKGATLGASELPIGYVTAASSLIGQGKLDEAKGLLDNLEAWYEADWKRQKEYEQRYPTESLGLEMAGGVIPTAPAAKIAQTGLKEGMSFGKHLLQMGQTGAAATGVYKASELAALPQSMKPDVLEQAKDVGLATGVGAAVGPGVGLAVEGVVRSPELIRKAATSGPVLKFASAILGPPAKVMKQYADQAAEITKLPSIEDVNTFFGAVRDRLTDISRQSEADLIAAKTNVESLERQIAEQSSGAKADVAAKLDAAKDQLRLIKEDLTIALQSEAKPAYQQAKADKMAAYTSRVEALKQEIAEKSKQAGSAAKQRVAIAKQELAQIEEDLAFEKSSRVAPSLDVAIEEQKQAFKQGEAARRADFDVQSAKYKESLKDPQMSPYVEAVNNSLEQVKLKLVDQSRAAAELIHDDVFFDTKPIVNFWKDELKKLKLPGTSVITGEPNEIAARKVENKIKNLLDLPPRVTGQQIKALLKSYDAEAGGSYLTAGKFGEVYPNALKSVRRQIDGVLKAENPEYAAAIKPAADLAEFLNEANRILKQDESIEGALRKAIDNPRIENIFTRLETESGISLMDPIRTGQERRAIKGLPLPKFEPGQPPDFTQLPQYKELQELLLQQKYLKAANLKRGEFDPIRDREISKRIEQLRQEIEVYSSPDVVAEHIASATQQPRSQLEALGGPPDLKALPEYQQMKNLQAQRAMIEAQNFNRGVFEAVKDTPTAQAIVSLRAQMKKFSDPEYVQAEIMAATQQGRMSLEQAQVALENLAKEREAASKWMRQIIGDHITKPEDLTMKLLRASDNPVEQAQATKIIDAVTQLPTPLFNDLFDSLFIGSPQEAQKMFRSLRVDDAMNKARANGSKGVNMMKAIFVGAGAGASGGAALGSNTAWILGAFGAMAGALRDNYGGQVAKQFLRSASKIQGIPTAGKLASAAMVRETAPFKNVMAVHLADMASSTDPDAMYFVAEATKPAVERDIKQSKMSALDRAKALNELNQLGGITGKYVRRIMLDTVPAVSQPVKPEAQADLEADKPNMLERLSKRSEKSGAVNLASYLKQAT